MDKFTHAIDFLSKKDFESALQVLNEILEEEPDNLKALKNAGLCYLNLKDYDNATKTFKKAEELCADDATTLYYLASLAILTDNSKDAIKYSKRVIELRPEYFDAYKILFSIYMKEKQFKNIVELQKQFSAQNIQAPDDTIYMIIATTYMMNKDYPMAIEFLKESMKISPDKVQIYNNLGVCYMSLKDYDAAINMFMTSVQKDENNATTYTNLGTVFQIKGEFLKALESYNKALELEPDNFLNLLNVGNLSNLLRRYDLAINAYEKILKINPSLKDVENSLIGAYVKNNQPDKAINLIDVALKFNHKNVPLLFRKAKIYTDLGDFSTAQRVYEQIIAFKKTSPTIYHAYAILYTKMQDYDKALKYLNKSLTLDDENASAHKDLGVIYLLRNQVEYAKDEFEKAVKLGQNDNEILKECADFYYSISDFNMAEKLYRQSLTIENNPFTTLSLGINLIAQNRLDEAFATLEPLMSVLPDNAELLYNLARILYAQKNYDMASRMARKAYFLVPTIEIANLLGLCLKELEDFKGAANIFEKIIEKYPLNTFIYKDLIECYKKLNDKEGIIKAYNTAISNLPYDENTIVEFVNTLTADGNIDEAKKILDKAIFEHPSEKLKELEQSLIK